MHRLWRRLNSEEGHDMESSVADHMSFVMEEIKLSYHLLFASTRASRRRFRLTERRRCKASTGINDSLLTRLCTEKQCQLLPVEKLGRRSFSATRDFRVFGPRLSAIQTFMMTSEPKSIWYLWRDGRSIEKITTFHAVLVFGTLGVIFAIIQTVLSGLQLRYARLQVEQGA